MSSFLFILCHFLLETPSFESRISRFYHPCFIQSSVNLVSQLFLNSLCSWLIVTQANNILDDIHRDGTFNTLDDNDPFLHPTSAIYFYGYMAVCFYYNNCYYSSPITSDPSSSFFCPNSSNFHLTTVFSVFLTLLMSSLLYAPSLESISDYYNPSLLLHFIIHS